MYFRYPLLRSMKPHFLPSVWQYIDILIFLTQTKNTYFLTHFKIHCPLNMYCGFCICPKNTYYYVKTKGKYQYVITNIINAKLKNQQCLKDFSCTNGNMLLNLRERNSKVYGKSQQLAVQHQILRKAKFFYVTLYGLSLLLKFETNSKLPLKL